MADSKRQKASQDHMSKVFNNPDLLKRTLAFAGSSIMARSTCTTFRNAHPCVETHISYAMSSREVLSWSVKAKLPPFPSLLGYARFGDVVSICARLKKHKTTKHKISKYKMTTNQLTECALEAARNGQVESLGLFIDAGCDKRNICSTAAGSGHLHVLQFAHTRNCPLEASTCDAAVRNGHLEVVNWALSNGCKWSTKVCNDAAYSGDLEKLQLARSKGYPWDARTCALAARRGHLHIIQWAHQQG